MSYGGYLKFESSLLRLRTSNKLERTQRSPGRSVLVVPLSNLKTKGEQAFSVQTPQLWNDLLEEVREANLFASKSLLKTHYLDFTVCFHFLFVVFDHILVLICLLSFNCM